MTIKCIDCKKDLNANACYYNHIRCNSCAAKERAQNPKKHSHYIDGRSLKQCYCKECRRPLSNYRATRCNSCELKRRYLCKIMSGSNVNKEKYKKIWMKSSYEIAYAKWLDKQMIKWQYEPKTFDLGDTTYTPDFYLPKTDTYIEIKGYWWHDAKKKFKLFKKLYTRININLLEQTHLKYLGVL